MPSRTPYLASLRVYEPLEAFPPEAQRQWRTLADSADQISEGDAALRRMIRPEPVHLDGAHFIEREGILHVCPWSTADRSLAALENFRESLPPAVAQFFLPPGSEAVLGEPSGEPAHIETETWLVPPRWLTLFAPEEREYQRINDVPLVRYRTSMANARKRAARHLRTIREAFGDGPVTAENTAQARWLEHFHPRSIVELDYGGLAAYLEQALADQGGLSADSSVEDVLASLDGLERGDGLAAGLGYQRLVGRWRAVALFEHAS